MTNEQIILEARVMLMKQGILAPTDKVMVIETDEGKKELPIPEEIHTFQAWKELGFKVKKGEHSVAHFPIWKYTEKRKDDGELEDSHMFMKVAHFFKPSQVEVAE